MDMKLQKKQLIIYEVNIYMILMKRKFLEKNQKKIIVETSTNLPLPKNGDTERNVEISTKLPFRKNKDTQNKDTGRNVEIYH